MNHFFNLGKTISMLALSLLMLSLIGCSKQAPDVGFTDLTGKKISLSQLKGKVVMINFWATSCGTCVAEMPDMIKTYEKFHPDGLEFFAVAMSYDPPNYVINFTETRALPFHVALDVDGKLAKDFGDVKVTPTTFVINKEGRIIKKYVGKPDFDRLHHLLEVELGASTS